MATKKNLAPSKASGGRRPRDKVGEANAMGIISAAIRGVRHQALQACAPGQCEEQEKGGRRCGAGHCGKI